MTHLIQSDSKEFKVKSSRVHITCRSCWGYSDRLCPGARVDQTLALVHFARFSFDSFSPVRIVKAYAISMENDLNNPDASVTNAGLKAEFGKFEERLDKKLDRLLSEQANVILEAVGETMEKKLDDKFDPVITKLDGIGHGSGYSLCARCGKPLLAWLRKRKLLQPVATKKKR